VPRATQKRGRARCRGHRRHGIDALGPRSRGRRAHDAFRRGARGSTPAVAKGGAAARMATLGLRAHGRRRPRKDAARTTVS
jgi:hypothetical protein